MNPNRSSPNQESSPSGNLPVSIGFAVGLIGGMALYYLANPKAASKMKTKLMELYEQAKDGSFEAKDALIAELHHSIELLPETSAVEFKPQRTQNFDLETPPSLIERLTQGISFLTAALKPAPRDNTVTHLKVPKTSKKKNTPPKRYFTQH